jgi:hypothetical protein
VTEALVAEGVECGDATFSDASYGTAGNMVVMTKMFWILGSDINELETCSESRW